jgi:hypothetical protein
MDPVKRKKLRDLIFGSRSTQQVTANSYFSKMQKEDLKNDYRNLKINNNITKDENVRLKTKLQQIQAELNHRDKEIEKLTLKLQQALGQPMGEGVLSSGVMGGPSHHFAESFIVSQLKKSNRDLKMEVQEKDRLIEQLKRNIKMSKSHEIEVELTVYIDECLRLRQQLEQLQIERQMMQQTPGMASGGNMQELANLEEAFRYQEMELQKERENASNLQEQLMQMQDSQEKLKEKGELSKKRLKKINELLAKNKRQALVLENKNKENMDLKH